MDGRTALELAESKLWGMLYQLITTSPENAEECDDFGMMPLHWACTSRDVQPRVVRKLVDAYPTAVMLKNKGGLMPLHIAVKANVPLEVLQILVLKNDDAICEETPAGETPVELAEMFNLAPEATAYLRHVEDKLQSAGRAPPRATRFRPLSSSGSMRNLGIDDATAVMMTSSSSSRASDFSGKRQDVSMLRARGLRVPSSGLLPHVLPPRWKLDKKCNICQIKFSYFKSRHHCRNCGVSVCSTHSSKRLPLEHIGLDGPQRVCIMCHDELRENGKPPSAVVNLYSSSKKHDAELDNGTSSSRGGRRALANMSNSFHGRASLTHSQAVTFVESSATSERSTAPIGNDEFNDSDEDDDNHHHHDYNTTKQHPVNNTGMVAAAPSSRSGRPRAQTGIDGPDRLAAMKDQKKELEAHMRDLLDQTSRMKAAIEASNRKVQHAIQEKHTHETSIADARGDKIIDVSRVTDDDELEKNVRRVSSSVDDAMIHPEELQLPDDAALNVAATCHYLGLALFERGDTATAIQEFRKSISLNRCDADVWYNLARALHSMDESFEAEIAAKRALDLRPKNYAAMSLLGKILHARGEHDKSIDVFQRALGMMTMGSDSDDDEEDVGSMTVGW